MIIEIAFLVATLGCTSVAAPVPPQVTFNQHVAPVIYKQCTGCHRTGEAAPFTLMSYADVAKHGKLIAAITAARIMPPWKAAPASYPYKDSRRLSDDEIKMIAAWVRRS